MAHQIRSALIDRLPADRPAPMYRAPLSSASASPAIAITCAPVHQRVPLDVIEVRMARQQDPDVGHSVAQLLDATGESPTWRPSPSAAATRRMASTSMAGMVIAELPTPGAANRYSNPRAAR